MLEAVRLSDAKSPDDLFRDMLLLTLEMRKVQPSMATLRTLTGKLLCQADLARTDACIDDYRITVQNIAQKILNESEEALADAATNLMNVIGSCTRILTHSHSSTVKRGLKLVYNSGRRLVVYVTRSQPGNEGEPLAYDL
jgi:translation initiation factor 2B subunit (eIF-2B alpha/beta/delta family)